MKDQYRSCHTSARQNVLPESADLTEILSMIESTRNLVLIFKTSPEPQLIYVSSNSASISGYSPEDYLANPTLSQDILKPIGLELNTHTLDRFRIPLGPIPCYIPCKKGLPVSADLLCKLSSGRLIFCIQCQPQVRHNANHPDFSDKNLPATPLVMGFQPDGKLIFANQIFEEVTGYLVSEVTGEDWKSCGLFSRETTDLIIKMFQDRKPDTGQPFELQLIHKNGQTCWFSGHSRIINRDNKPSYLQLSASDITICKKSEKMLRLTRFALEQTTDAIFWTDSEGNFVDVNQSACNSLDYRREDLLKLKVTDIDALITNQTDWEAHWKNLKNSAYLSFESIHRNISGEEIPVEITANYMQCDKMEYNVAIARNIHLRKEAEKQLKFTSFSVEHTADSVLWVNQSGSIIAANMSACQSLGYTRTELCSLNVININPVCVAERWKTLWVRLKQAINFSLESDMFTKNGQQIPIEVMCNFLEFEGIDYCCAVLRDITERKKVDARLLRAAEEWRITFDNISDIVFLLDNDFNIQRANRAFTKTLNCQPQDVLNKKCYQVLHHADCPKVNCPKLIAFNTKKTQRIAYFEENIDKHFEETIDPILDANGLSMGTVHTIKDVTEHHKIAAQLMITDRLASLGELSAGLAHELNNPLTSVIGFSELIQEKILPEDLRQDIQIISQEAQRAAEIIRNLLTFARRHEPSKDWVDMNQIIHKVLAICNYGQKVHNIQLITNLDPNLPEIKADYFQMQQVLLNIVINAEYFMTHSHGEGTIVISSHKFNDSIQISIRDDGPGMSENVLNHIFDPFFTTKEVGKGTGLGLSIGHGIITQHGGKLYAESSEGKGATFFIEIPINQPD
ncbi:PAS domain-containing sensor histidine kinase [Dehalococcoides mccartyi]|jgi:PAS domain S-box-containing protein|uniref:PAS domain S-box protein n=1 Tax=Dehalococcoides mccartyi TaxID=61435 RepID=UPI00098EEBA3|nr:PAS domain S-box protein [Dehalococcoides mccartyi]AQU05705.1 PAS domain-containing sensor histidine kinase [Dehalococcoides mccartyi]AQU07151.1 PAS domain-containing sensor histidine kinase [Dehalococcoides mccartyi]AQX74435.1 PAS domain-containing sensor histidine kinase [Dehalococcoides mccartyi]AQY73012.1 PAS domain-containing sensor histidine kinase [Dehalococcoides mccartyi]